MRWATSLLVCEGGEGKLRETLGVESLSETGIVRRPYFGIEGHEREPGHAPLPPVSIKTSGSLTTTISVVPWRGSSHSRLTTRLPWEMVH